MERKTLSLKKPVDPEKIARSLQLGFRFVDRKGRYILQQRMVTYGPRATSKDSELTLCFLDALSATWVDIPLCPETYGEAQA